MTDELGQYANIPHITQSVTFKTLSSHKTWLGLCLTLWWTVVHRVSSLKGLV